MPSFSSLDRGTIHYHSAFFQRGGRDLCFLFLRARAQVTLGLSSRKASGLLGSKMHEYEYIVTPSPCRRILCHLDIYVDKLAGLCLTVVLSRFLSVSEKREQGKTEEKEKELQKSCLSTSPDRK